MGQFVAKNLTMVENISFGLVSFGQGFSDGLSGTTTPADVSPMGGNNLFNSLLNSAGSYTGDQVKENFVGK